MKTYTIHPDGTTTTTGVADPLTDAQLKEIGKPYTLNGITYQVPLNEETQNGVVAITVQQISGLFTKTVFHFSNGVNMPITNAEWLDFATWFATERGKFFAQ